MLKRNVLIGEAVYTLHVVNGISVADEGRRIYVESWKSAADMEDSAKSPVSRAFLKEGNTEQDYSEAYAYISALPEFEEYTDKLDEVLAILTDEQAEQVPDAFPIWRTGKSYAAGYRVRYDGILYKCVQAHTSQEGWEPDVAHSLWSKVGEGDIPEWIQPTGAHDAYSKGDKVRHGGKVWVSEINANTYEPGVYGWGED